MSGRRIGERVQLARKVRKRIARYLYWMEACGRDEDKAHAVLMLACRDLERLVNLHEGRPADD